MLHIDLNSDLGESYGAYQMGHDNEVIPVVSSVNVACGFHAGDFRVMHQTVRLAKQHQVAVGAHPGYPDLQGFGRRVMPYSPDEVYDMVIYQIGALAGFTRAEQIPLHHVKPHGALYNVAAVDVEVANAIAHAVYDFDKNLILFGLSGSRMIEAGQRVGLRVASEVFADRNYQADGTLVSRSHPQALLKDPAVAADRVVQMVETGRITAIDGQEISLQADTVCIHGDGPEALAFARQVRRVLEARGVTIRAM